MKEIKNILKRGDPLPVAFFVFIGCIIFGISVLLHAENTRVIPIIEIVSQIISQDAVAVFSLVIGICGTVSMALKKPKLIAAFLLTACFLFMFVSSMFAQSDYYRQSTGIAYIIMSLASSWAVIRGIE